MRMLSSLLNVIEYIFYALIYMGIECMIQSEMKMGENALVWSSETGQADKAAKWCILGWDAEG